MALELKQVKKLRKRDLVHILDGVYGLEDVEAQIVTCRKAQRQDNIICYDCEIIARKLGLEGVE